MVVEPSPPGVLSIFFPMDVTLTTFCPRGGTILTSPPCAAFNFADEAFPSFHSRSTASPPRARNPLNDPFGQADGNAGNRRISGVLSPLLCNNISAIPEQPPKLPSIWNGGWRQNRFSAEPPPPL